MVATILTSQRHLRIRRNPQTLDAARSKVRRNRNLHAIYCIWLACTHRIHLKEAFSGPQAFVNDTEAAGQRNYTPIRRAPLQFDPPGGPPKADTPVDNRTCSNASGRCSRCFVSESTRLCSPSLQYSLMMSHLVLQCQNRISGHTRVKFGGKPATQFRTRAELATLQGQRRNTRSEGAARRLTTRGDLACSNAYRRISRCLGASLSQKKRPQW